MGGLGRIKMVISIPERIETARAGTNPTVICRVPSGWVAMCDTQFLCGYCILLADPAVTSLNDLSQAKRAEFLSDMAAVGDALLAVTDAYRINYVIAGNTDPYLHAHIVPRYMSEPEEFRKGLPWSHPHSERDSILFDYRRDKPLMDQLRQAIQNR
jgi:diadenosine tetraphosphate (Ap4A) HIT family hydrolase